jgi:hypothetical protein
LDSVPPEIADIQIHDIIRNWVQHGMSSLADHMEAVNDGFAIVNVINDIPDPIAPHTHYWYQSEALANFSLIEYCSIIKVIKRPPQLDDDTVTRGRRPNGTYLFHPDHPLFNNYYQKLRSKQATPILTGEPPPRYPGNKLDPCTDLRVCKFQAFLKYYLTLFYPWDLIIGLIPHAFNFMGYSDFVQVMAQSGSFLSRARPVVMESTICALLQDCKKLVDTAMYCSLNADHMVGKRFAGPQYNNNAADTDYDDTTAQANGDATLLINIIQAEAQTAHAASDKKTSMSLAFTNSAISSLDVRNMFLRTP